MKLVKLLLWLLGLVIALILVSLIFSLSASRQLSSVSGQPAQMQDGVRVAPSQLPATAADTVAVQENEQFQFLVSYTDSGFEPLVTTVEAGDTVRFTNNSTGSMWIAATGTTLYPLVRNGCGSSALDSCVALAPGQSWQFTFNQKGTWQFYNNLNKANVGTINVE
jgi:plastocyanin